MKTMKINRVSQLKDYEEKQSQLRFEKVLEDRERFRLRIREEKSEFLTGKFLSRDRFYFIFSKFVRFVRFRSS